MDSLQKLEEIFLHFPGIGPRQAKRFVYHLLNKTPASIKEFTDLVAAVRKTVAECPSCHRFFIRNGDIRARAPGISATACPVCADRGRDASLLMVVARDSDFEAMERSGAYRGLYFILGGTVPILDKDPAKRIRLKALLQRLAGGEPPKEIILSLNATVDGEHTAEIVREAIVRTLSDSQTKVTILGRGLSTGSELEYADANTIKSALHNRH